MSTCKSCFNKRHESSNSIPRKTLVGEKFGRLTVKSFSHRRGANAVWICECSCGNETKARQSDLRSGNTSSCGCLRLELGRGEPRNVALGLVSRIYRRNAKSRGYEFHLSQDQVNDLAEANCHYCGAEPSCSFATYVRNKQYIKYPTNGIDRIDNDGDYTIDNVVTACSKCNLAKRKMSSDEFLGWVSTVYKHSALSRSDDDYFW